MHASVLPSESLISRILKKNFVLICFISDRSALSPPRPYPPNQAKAKLAGAVFVPIMLVTAVVPAHIWSQIISFGFGFGFFGQPLIIRGVKFVSRKVPNWKELLQEKLDLRK